MRRLAVLAVLVGLAAPSFAPGHSLTETDRDCGPVVLGAGHARLKISAAQSPVQQDEHCAFCHWHRAFGNAAPMAVVAVVPHLDAAFSVAVADDLGSATTVAGLRPTRAPPALDTL